MKVYWRDVVERALTTAGYTGVLAVVGDVVDAVNVSIAEAGAASLGGAVLAFLGSLIGRHIGDQNTASLDPAVTYGKHHRPD